MAGLLEATIARWASTPCDPNPCAKEVWRYVCEAQGAPISPLPPHRTKRAMVALLRERGGLAAYVEEMMTSTAWQKTALPSRGCVGLVRFDDIGLTCAICLGERWMAKGDGFVIVRAAPVIAAWRLPECHKL